MGIPIARTLAAGALASALLLCGCKKGKDSNNAARENERSSAGSQAVRFDGMYTYIADAANFVDCDTAQRWPVAMEGDNASLERAYGRARAAPGTPLLVSVEGRLAPRPRVDRPGEEPNLVVERYLRVWPGETCQSVAKAMLESSRWELVELQGQPIPTRGTGSAPYLELNAAKSSAYGFGGCNRFFGSYEATETTLKLGALGATRMACPEGMDREQELFRALDAATRYEIHGSELLLYSDETLVARFEAREKPAPP